MKHLAAVLLPVLLFPAACHAGGDRADDSAALAEAPAAASKEAETSTVEITFEQQDAPRLADRIRVFLDDMPVRVEAPDARTWIVSGPARDVNLIRVMALSFDGPLSTLTPEHVARVYDIEHRDPRLLANSVRGRPDWGASWIVIARPESRWYAMVPRDEIGAFEGVLEEIDRPD